MIIIFTFVMNDSFLVMIFFVLVSWLSGREIRTVPQGSNTLGRVGCRDLSRLV